MTTSSNKQVFVEAVRKTKVETTYEYVPLLGEILGYWRKHSVDRIGDSIEIHVNTPIGNWDKIVINGKEIKVN